MKNQVIVWIRASEEKRRSSPGIFRSMFPGRIDVKETERAGERAFCLTLPLSPGQLALLGEKARDRLWERAARRIERLEGGEPVLILEDGLSCRLMESRIVDGGALPYLYLDDLLYMAAKEHHIARRDMDLLLIDGEEERGSVDLDALVARLYQDKNRFSIRTGRPAYFERRAEEAYEDTGLLIRLTDRADSGNIVVDLGGFHKERLWEIPKGAVYLDLEPEVQKVRNILAKRKDLVYYNRFSFSLNGSREENSWIQAVIYGEPTGYIKSRLDAYSPSPRVRPEGLGTRRTEEMCGLNPIKG